MLGFNRGEKRVARVIRFFEKLETELLKGADECVDQHLALHDAADGLQRQAEETRVKARAVGESIGKAHALRNGLRNLMNGSGE